MKVIGHETVGRDYLDKIINEHGLSVMYAL